MKKFFQGFVVLEEVYSPINGKIQVLEDVFGKRRLVVGGLTQSGEAVEKIWRKTISNFQFPISNCLILGLGAGSAAKVINKFFPETKILGIEIDREIIRLGKKYFGLDEIKNLKIINKDAIFWLRDCSNDSNHENRRFQLVLVDLYVGDWVPGGVETDKFLENVKGVLESGGLAIFNRLYYSEKKEKTDKFWEKLKKYFSKIEAKKIKTNKLFLCQNKGSKQYF